jgi:GDPmannose 4,6-dehydratase
MLQQDTADDYVIATGQTRSIIAFLDRAFAHVGINSWEKYVVQNPEFMRPAEVPHLRGNPAKAKEKLNWENETSFEKLIEIMMNADLKRYTR